MPAFKDNRSATIKDVARVAGVHFTTVSMALRDHPSIPEATRVRIRAAAQELGYTRNPVFSALTRFHVQGRKRAEAPTLGFVMNQPARRQNEFFRGADVFLEGAREQARRLGYSIDVLHLGAGQHDSSSLQQHLRAHLISGVVIAGFEPGQQGLSLDWDEFAVVKINSMHVPPAAMIVANDHRQDVRMGFRQLQARGYRRIGLAISRADEESAQHRYSAGFLIEQRCVPESRRVPPLLFPLAVERAEAVHWLHEWVRQHRVDAVLSPCPTVAELLTAAAFRVPTQVACACLALPDEGSATLAGVRPNYRTVGAKAISQLATQLKVGERGVPEFSPQTYVPSHWQEGRSAPGRS